MKSDERFRRNFILVMTVAYTIAFIAMVGGFAEALLMAAVFAGIMYPLYRWFETGLGGRSTSASLLTLLTTVLAILIPLILLSTLGGVALFGATGLVLSPILAAWFLTVLAIYSEVFADWFHPKDSSQQRTRAAT